MAARFDGSFTQQEPIPEAGIDSVVAILRSGRLHRYNLAGDEAGVVAMLEAAYADWQGARYCLAVTSGGQTMQIALRAAGIGPGDVVATNAFTLAPVPGAIAAVGATGVLVETDADLVIDLDDLIRMARKHRPKALLLSHMRGHLCDMDRAVEICTAHGIILIEDCAHTMGARWSGRMSGNFGLAGCFSTQTYKHMNSGEGGLLTSDDAAFMARATILSGSYMNFASHGAGPALSEYGDARLDMPNTSARMDMVRAAILLPQLPALDRNIDRWAARYDCVAGHLEHHRIVLPKQAAASCRVGSSLQFRVPHLSASQCEDLVRTSAARGVEIKWFGRADPLGFTSAHPSWRYMAAQELPGTDLILATLFDMRIPLTFSLEDCGLIGRILREEALAAGARD